MDSWCFGPCEQLTRSRSRVRRRQKTRCQHDWGPPACSTLTRSRCTWYLLNSSKHLLISFCLGICWKSRFAIILHNDTHVKRAGQYASRDLWALMALVDLGPSPDENPKKSSSPKRPRSNTHPRLVPALEFPDKKVMRPFIFPTSLFTLSLTFILSFTIV